jgi:hypothetical protein
MKPPSPFINVLLFFASYSFFAPPLPAQPDSIRQRCDEILRHELGKRVFQKHVTLKSFEEIRLHRPGRSDYRLAYKFTFPEADSASFEILFVCAVYNGEMHVQSGYFLRHHRSDLPAGFSKKRMQIIGRARAIEIACAADTLLAAHRHRLDAALALTQDALEWVVGFYETISNPEGDAEDAVWRGKRVDPWSGEKEE